MEDFMNESKIIKVTICISVPVYSDYTDHMSGMDYIRVVGDADIISSSEKEMTLIEKETK